MKNFVLLVIVCVTVYFVAVVTGPMPKQDDASLMFILSFYNGSVVKVSGPPEVIATGEWLEPCFDCQEGNSGSEASRESAKELWVAEENHAVKEPVSDNRSPESVSEVALPDFDEVA